MIISSDLLSRLLESMERAGIKLPSRPVQSLVLNTELLEAVKRKRDAILADIGSSREQAEKVLDAIISGAETVRDGLSGKNPVIRNIFLSYVISLLNGWGLHDMLTKDALRSLPEIFTVVTSNSTMHIMTPVDNELSKTLPMFMLKEQIESLMKSYLEKSLKLDPENMRLEIAGTVLSITSEATMINLLFEIGRSEEAKNYVYTKVWDVLNTNVPSYVERVEMPQPDDLVIVIKKSAFLVPKDASKIMENTNIVVRAKVSYKTATLYDVRVELDSEIGVIRIPIQTASIDRVDNIVKNAVSTIQAFLNIYAPVLILASEEGKRLGFVSERAGENAVGLNVGFKREDTVSYSGKSVKIHAYVRATAVPLSERVEGKVRVETDSEAIKNIVLNELKKMSLESDFSAYGLAISDAGETSFEITLSDVRFDELPNILGVINVIAKDVEILLRQVMTRQAESVSQRLAEENYLALYTALALMGVRNVVEKMSEYTGKTATELQRVIRSYLDKFSVQVEPDSILKTPETLVAELVNRDILTVSENLEIMIGGKRISELLEPVKQLEREYSLPALLSIITEQIIRVYYATKKRSVLLDMLRSGKSISIDMVIKYIESKAPIEVEVLKQRTIWEQLPSDAKLKALRLLPVEQVMLIEKDDALPKTREDYELIIEAICSGTSPSRCTEYIFTTHPDYIDIPKTVKLVEHRGEKWIDAGLYRVQVERIVGGTTVFRVEEKTSGKLLRIEAKNSLREAIYKAVREETEEAMI